MNVSWNYSIITTLSNNETGSVDNTQTTLTILIDNCSTYSMRAINFSLRNETDNALVSGEIAGHYNLYLNTPSNTKAFNLSWTGSQFGLCISPDSAIYNMSGQMEYTATGFETATYYFNDYTIDNSTEVIDLYLADGTTPVTFTVKDQDDNLLPNVFISVLKYDIGTDSFITTEIIKTSEPSGAAVGHIILNTQYYKFLLNYNGQLVQETEETILTTTARNFRVNLLTDYLVDYDVYENTATTLTWTNATTTFSYTFNQQAGDTITGCLSVIKRTINGDTLLNETCQTTTSATINVDLGTNLGSNTYIATGYIISNGETFLTDTLSIEFDELFKTWGINGIFVSFLILLTLVLIGIWNPIVSVVLMTVGMISLVVLGLFQLTFPILMAFTIISILTLYRLNRT